MARRPILMTGRPMLMVITVAFAFIVSSDTDGAWGEQGHDRPENAGGSKRT